ncbi:MAG: hypothetical protein KC432_06760, partial [Thermomicrobiales bacterium]|nr:hypothetical protein [Thermomicrobiales bacterium]
MTHVPFWQVASAHGGCAHWQVTGWPQLFVAGPQAMPAQVVANGSGSQAHRPLARHDSPSGHAPHDFPGQFLGPQTLPAQLTLHFFFFFFF